MIAQSCPPINYPEPNYYIRGMQQDPMPKSILKDEIKMSKNDPKWCKIQY